ncbi:hypothetical protein AOLI_G00038700 [Acnodon oligacanthus]
MPAFVGRELISRRLQFIFPHYSDRVTCRFLSGELLASSMHSEAEREKKRQTPALWTSLLMTYCSVEIAIGIAKGPDCALPCRNMARNRKTEGRKIHIYENCRSCSKIVPDFPGRKFCETFLTPSTNQGRRAGVFFGAGGRRVMLRDLGCK